MRSSAVSRCDGGRVPWAPPRSRRELPPASKRSVAPAPVAALRAEVLAGSGDVTALRARRRQRRPALRAELRPGHVVGATARTDGGCSPHFQNGILRPSRSCAGLGHSARHGPRHLQHQGRRGKDLGRGEPRLPRRARWREHVAVGSRPAGSEHVPPARQAQDQGRGSPAGARQDRRGERGSRAPTTSGSICCRPISPTGTWTCTSTPPSARPAVWPRPRAAGTRIRLRVPGLPAEHLAGVRERVRGGRRAAHTVASRRPVGPHARPHRRGGRRRRPAAARSSRWSTRASACTAR